MIFFCADGKINPKGSTKDKHGVWLPRTQKHRYAFLLDKKLNIFLKEEVRPKRNDTKLIGCCGGTCIVFDKRFNKKYTCPKCKNELKEIKK